MPQSPTQAEAGPVDGPQTIMAPAEQATPQPITQAVANTQSDKATEVMEIRSQDPVIADNVIPARDLGQPAKWGVRALGKPHSFLDGENAVVMVVANTRPALTNGAGGFAGHAASAAAGTLGMAGKVYIKNETHPYPVDPDSLERLQAAPEGCIWGKTFTLSTRG